MDVYFVSYEIYGESGVLKSKGFVDITASNPELGFSNKVSTEIKKSFGISDKEKLVIVSISKL